MAKLYPAQLPNRVLNDRQLKGEIDTFNALSNLSDEFEVFYNRCPNSGGASRGYERKIDFIIIHEQLGLLAMEVKGGKIRIGTDGGFEQYHYEDGWVPVDPFDQVKKAVRELIKTIKSDSPKYWIPDDSCVIFPGTYRHVLTDMPQSLPAGTLCADELSILNTVIPSLFTNKKRAAWTRDTFIDVRRRLQNMPQANTGKQSLAGKTLANATALYERKFRKTSEFEYHIPIGEVRPAKRKETINYNPSPSRVFEVKNRGKIKAKLKWWEVVLAIGVFISTVWIVLWLFPSSFLHR